MCGGESTCEGDATPCMTVLPSDLRVRSVLRVANVASASNAVVQNSVHTSSEEQNVPVRPLPPAHQREHASLYPAPASRVFQ